jgi:23S rRNA (adenine2030-N6)-methyltransferase
MPRRGLALIDPAFEDENEFATLTRTVQAMHRRWATGLLAIWYPIKDQRETDRWKRELAAPIAAATIAVELTVRPARESRQMNGSGLIIVNPPWQFDDALRPRLDFLKTRLAREAGAGARIETLVKAA